MNLTKFSLAVRPNGHKQWLSSDLPYVRSLRPIPWNVREQHHYHRYNFDIGDPYYGYLTAVKTTYPLTSITWPIVGSDLEVACFLKLAASQVRLLEWIRLKPAYTLGEKEGMCVKKHFRLKLTPGALSTFLPTYSMQSHFLDCSE